ncbi:MAG: DMT family transporter [Alphaproteobacteria bacterium]
MMESAAFFGAGTAAIWGVTDLVARFSGRSVGVLVSALGLMAIGSVALLPYILATGATIDWDAGGFWLIAASGLGMAFGTLLLFAALTRGPVSLASPVVASYPAITVPASLALGARPEPIHWLAMLGTMAGVWLVARAVARHADSQLGDYARSNQRGTLLLAIASAVLFALALIAADLAIERYGWLQTLIGSRLVGAAAFAIVLAFRRHTVRPMPAGTWLLLLVLALLDTSGHAVLYVGLALPDGEYAVVASAAYTGVTTVLAWLFLREPVSRIQWLGIGLIIGGVAVLASAG